MAAAQASPREAVDLRLREAQRFKEEGNRCYKEGCFRDAVRRYHRALLQLRGLDPSVPCPLQAFGSQAPRATPEQEQALQATQADCYNNLAACLLRMEPVNYERVKEYSLKVLEKQPENAKALYRAGVATYHLRDYDRARRYLAEATRWQPRDTNVQRYLQLTESQLSTYHQKEKQLYLGMFG
ncbi:tetratricopeptide repeat protein 9C isoform X1 [Alligator mississippiensis]|uniref:Tetratricopeptide repeat protein 9C n=1 Tax=Alligator mississippiensis TaxID=8496 RepID=A0A151NT10_ALLMI|nr:tetratricopeptide repeat protein 9C isoform X1 [Alligator mississippiensis]KYO39997.1 tetratricopeptide repeat protein 9C [Alligator mississippiensis]